MYALRHYLCSYTVNFGNDEEATDEKCETIFSGVSKLQNMGCAKEEDLCLNQTLPRT